MIGEALGGLGGAIGGIAVLAGAAGKGGKQDYENALRLWQKLQTPGFDMSTLTAPELQMVAQMQAQQYSPQVSGQLALGEESPQARQAQVRALQQMQQVAQEGLPQADALAAQEMQRQAGAAHQRYTQAALNQLAAQGRLGGGADIAARLGAGQQAAELARGVSSDINRDAMMRRLQAIQQSGQFASGLRGQDIDFSMRNALERNAYNQWLSGLNTNVAAQNALARERAQNYNVGTAQGIANQNVANRYANQERNQQYLNQLRQQGFTNDVTRTQGLAGAFYNYGDLKERERAAKAQNIQNIGQGLGKGIGGIADFGAGGGFGL